jgi:hypothetical protein
MLTAALILNAIFDIKVRKTYAKLTSRSPAGKATPALETTGASAI